MKIVLATSGRRDGSMGFSSDLYIPTIVANRARFFRKFGINPSQVVLARQVHGVHVSAISKVPKRGFVFDADALVTDKPNIFLGIRSADCFPVCIFNERAGAIGIAHAGWRGVVKEIVPKMLRTLQRRYKIDPTQLKVIIGSGIRKCHYEVWPRTRHRGMATNNRVYRGLLLKRGKRVFADLEGAIKDQLRRSGIPLSAIHVTGECTYHSPQKFFSFRRDASKEHPRGFGNMISIIGMREK